jgi:hypothetical protein
MIIAGVAAELCNFKKFRFKVMKDLKEINSEGKQYQGIISEDLR